MIDTRIGDLNALAEKQSEVNSLFTLLVTYKKVKCLILRNLTGKAYFTRSNKKLKGKHIIESLNKELK